MAESMNLGFPRIGLHRELKYAQEQYWAGKTTEAELQSAARNLRGKHWQIQREKGIQNIPSNDFSLYDHVLDIVQLFGAIPKRYLSVGSPDSLEVYFAMARGIRSAKGTVPAMEMTKWFDTNYHYIVPEFDSDTTFSLFPNKIIDEWKEAHTLGIDAHPVLLGPLSFLLLGKSRNFDRFALIPDLLSQYNKLFKLLAEAGVSRVQLDEPVLVLDCNSDITNAFQQIYRDIQFSDIEILLCTYFGSAFHNPDLLLSSLPIHTLHIDCSYYTAPAADLAMLAEQGKKISLGLINGRNIWRADLSACMDRAEEFSEVFGSDALLIAPSCSLLHSPVDCSAETQFDEEFLSWLAFAVQKLDEVAILTKGLNKGRSSITEELKKNKIYLQNRSSSPRIHRPAIKEALRAVNPSMEHRKASYAERSIIQQKELKLPLFPTTTIGSFPQTKHIRKIRSDFRKNVISQAEYENLLKKEIADTITFQKDLGLDVLVHGEAERNDMVEYFGEQLEGFTVSKNGWVQSYGSRCVKPPIIFGDLERTHPMTIQWIRYAQSLSKQPVKGMLTGPVTILQWSFVRDDQPARDTAMQIAYVIRQEVKDLEKAGIKIIQVDEPAFREGMPLQRTYQTDYINWATRAFRLATAGVDNSTQIHTHMCYCEFNDSIEAIAKLDADVISIESSRSNMEILDSFSNFRYPNAIGPGIYDIHSPNIPSREEMLTLLKKALAVLEATQLWVNPDCGLKTRKWEEITPSLQNMVAAAKELRTEYQR